MNFLLNKIDTDLRRKVYEETRDGKVHSKCDIEIYKDAEKSRDKTFDKCLKEAKKQKKKSEGTKKIGEEIQVKGEIELTPSSDMRGNFLDTKK